MLFTTGSRQLALEKSIFSPRFGDAEDSMVLLLFVLPIYRNDLDMTLALTFPPLLNAPSWVLSFWPRFYAFISHRRGVTGFFYPPSTHSLWANVISSFTSHTVSKCSILSPFNSLTVSKCPIRLHLTQCKQMFYPPSTHSLYANVLSSFSSLIASKCSILLQLTHCEQMSYPPSPHTL